MVILRSNGAAAILLAFLAATGPGLAETHVLSHGALRVEIEIGTDHHAAEFGPRFDRTAAVTSVTVEGVELLGSWGLSDEFGLYGVGVLGYETAGAGDAFVKIGVGTLLRDTDDTYHFAHAYPVQRLFPVTIEATASQVSVRQQADSTLPHRYDYVKTYSVHANNVLTVRYQLTNTGESAWPFEHYNHHWFRLADAEVGPRYRATTGFVLPENETRFLRDGNSLHLAELLEAGEAAYYGSDLADVSGMENNFEWSVDHLAIVRYEGSFVPARFALFANEDGFCPEVFMRTTLAPGETASWSATYQFMPADRLADQHAAPPPR